MAATAGKVRPNLGVEGAFQRKVDTLPGYVFGPGHGSLAYHLQANACAGGDEQASYRARIITKEIKRANTKNGLPRTFNAAAPISLRRWLTVKGGLTRAHDDRCQFGAKNTAQELTKGASDAFDTEKQEHCKRKYQARWSGIFALKKLIKAADGGHPGVPAIRLAGGNRAFYETMSRAAPQKYVSRSTFLAVMRRVYGFDIAPLKGSVDHLVLHRLEEVYSAFDVDGRDKVDWRTMLFMLKVSMNAQETVEQHLRWGLALYSSPGILDPSSGEPVDMNDFIKLAFTLVKFDRVDDLRKVLNAAWKAVAMEDKEAERMTTLPSAGGIGGKTKGHPQKMREPLKDLIGPAKRFGRRDRRTWTYLIEEEFFYPLLLALVKNTRRAYRNYAAVATFRGNARRRTFRVATVAWQRLVRRRKRCVRLMMRIGSRFCRNNMSSVLLALRRRAIACNACETIQRTYRGYVGRLTAIFLRDLQAKIIISQAHFRGYRQRKQFVKWMQKKHQAATSLQKIVRGSLGRKRMQYILEKYFDREMAAVDAEVARLEYRNRIRKVTNVQRLWRTRRDRRKEEEEKLRTVRIHEVEAEMKQLQDHHMREIEIYKRELSVWFKERREEQERSRVLEDHTAEEKFKVICYRRREKDRLAEEKRLKNLAAADKAEEQRIEQWQMEWARKGEERAVACRKMIEAVLKHPDNEPEKALQKSLRAEIEAQTKTVLKMASVHEAELEAPDALAIAKEDVILRKMEEERQRVIEEMKAAATLYYEQEARTKADKKKKISKFLESKADAAARTIQKMYYTFTATRTTQKRAKEIYTKHFDPESLRYFWYNTQIRTYFWGKPTGLGGWDVDAEDRWMVIHGSYGLNYYYNPKTYRMQWSKPADTVVCEMCDIKFSTRWCTRDAKPYCENCFYQRHFSNQPITDNQLTYKELDGAEPGSRDLITFDFITEQPDILVEPWNTSTVITYGNRQDDGGWMKYDEESYEHVND